MSSKATASAFNKITISFLILFVIASAMAAYGFLGVSIPAPVTTTMTQTKTELRTMTVERTVPSAPVTTTVTEARTELRTVTLERTVTPESVRDTSGPPASLIDAAKKEGQLVVYDTAGKINIEPLINRFTSKYGIKVDFLQLSAAELLTRVAAEYQAGAYKVDIVGDSEILSYIKPELLLLQPFKIPGVEKVYPVGTFDPDGYYYPTFKNPTAVIYNPSKVSPQELKGVGWQQLANDPKWKNRIGIRELDKGGQIDFTIMLRSIFGAEGAREWVVRLIKNQKPLIHADHGFLRSAVARGEIDIMIILPETVYVRGIAAKENIKFHVDFPQGESTGPEWASFYGITRRAPHPNAAKLWQWFLVTNEGQQMIGERNTAVHPFVKSAGSSYTGLNSYLVSPLQHYLELQWVRDTWKSIKGELGI